MKTPKPRTYYLYPGLTKKKALSQVRKLESRNGYDMRGFKYDRQTGRAVAV